METRSDVLAQLVRTSFEPEQAERILSGFGTFVDLATDPRATVGISISGPFAATGHRLDGLAPLIEGGFVDWVVARGEDLYLDAEAGFERAHRGLSDDGISGAGPREHSVPHPPAGHETAGPPASGNEIRETEPTPSSGPGATGSDPGGSDPGADPAPSPRARESHAHERVRIGDQIFHRNQVLSTEEFLGRLVLTPPFQKTLATAELNDLLGRFLGERDRALGLAEPTSFLAVAHRHGIPVFSDSPGGSVVGRRIASAALSGNRLVLDLSRDVNLAAAVVLAADAAGRSVAVSIGGGSPRDLLVQASLHLENPLGLGTRFHKAFLEVAKPGRARLASRFRALWGDEAPPLEVVELASDLALPLLSAMWLHGRPVKEGRHLYASRDMLLEQIRDLYLRHDIERQVRQTGAQIQSQIQSKIEETQATLQAEMTRVQQQLQQQVQKLLQQVRTSGNRGRRDGSG